MSAKVIIVLLLTALSQMAIANGCVDAATKPMPTVNISWDREPTFKITFVEVEVDRDGSSRTVLTSTLAQVGTIRSI